MAARFVSFSLFYRRLAEEEDADAGRAAVAPDGAAGAGDAHVAVVSLVFASIMSLLILLLKD